jgi:RIP metalloprotease RseP
MNLARRHFVSSILAVIWAWSSSPSSLGSTSAFAFQQPTQISGSRRHFHNEPSISRQPLPFGTLSIFSPLIRRPFPSTTTTTSTTSVHSSYSRQKKTELHLAFNPLVVTIASSPVGAIIVLAGIVLVHESGHYLAARLFNITVDEFSIGFGPKLIGFKAMGNDFNLRALPLGGYVKFPENYNVTLVEEQQRVAQKAFQNRKKDEGWTTWQEFINRDERRQRERKRQQELEAAAAAKAAARQKWWYSVLSRKSNQSATNLPSPIDNPEDFQIDYYDDPNLLQNRPWTQRAVVLSMGVIFNLILSFTIYFGAIGPIGNGLPQPVFDSGVVVTAAPMKDGPAVGLLQKGDVIFSVNGTSWEDLFSWTAQTKVVLLVMAYSFLPKHISVFVLPPQGKPLQITRGTSISAAQKQVSEVISTIRATPDGESVELQVQRARKISTAAGNNDQVTSMSSTTPTTTSVTIQPRRSRSSNSNENAASVAPQSIGVFLSPNLAKVEKLQSNNPVVAAKLASQYLSDEFSQTLNGILGLLSQFVEGSAPPPGQSIAGPIGLIKQGSNVVSTRDWTAVFLFSAALSVNLAVINALPLPALDGGQLVFVIAEAITGRKVDQRFQEGITSVAVLFLLWVSVSTAIGDVGNILSGIL